MLGRDSKAGTRTGMFCSGEGRGSFSFAWMGSVNVSQAEVYIHSGTNIVCLDSPKSKLGREIRGNMGGVDQILTIKLFGTKAVCLVSSVALTRWLKQYLSLPFWRP